MNNIFYIRHKPTGNFMPVMKGPSYWDPVNHYYPPNHVNCARAFYSKRSATATLTQWLRGEHKPLVEAEQDGWNGPSYQVTVGTEVVPVAGRNRDDMEIVEYKLTEVR